MMQNYERMTGRMSLYNDSFAVLTLIIEPIHFVEELEPSDTFDISVEAIKGALPRDLFYIKHSNEHISITIENGMASLYELEVKLYLNQKLVYDFTI